MAQKLKLRTYILSVFLFLFCVLSGTIIAFTYKRNYSAILDFSKGAIDRVSDHIKTKVDCLLEEFATLPEMAVGVYKRHVGINLENRALIDAFLDRVKYHPNLYAFYVGDPAGNFLAVFNLEMTGNRNYFGERHETPDQATYALIVLEQKGDARRETWSYYDLELKQLKTEEIEQRTYDPRVRPWYVGAEKSRQEFWTDLFIYNPTNDLGVAVAKPVYGEKGELLAIIGADLSLELLSTFLKQQKVGKLGKAFIVGSTGEIFLPQEETKEKPLVLESIRKFNQTKQSDLIIPFKGEKYLASIERFPVPFNPNWMIAIIDPMSDFFGPIFRTQEQVVLISVAILILGALLVVYFSELISAPIVQLAYEVRKIQHLEFEEEEEKLESDIIEINMMKGSIRSLRSAIHSFGKYVPKEVVHQLMDHGHEIVLGGENRELTVFFSDITNFTSISETLKPEQINQMLSSYFAILTNLILSNHGTIDKYLGDGIMAFWGAPEELERPTELACYTALLCQKELNLFNQKQLANGQPVLATRFGINVGEGLVGNIGTPDRMNYTVLGDLVNITSRFQALNKNYHTEIIIGEKTASKLQGAFLTRPLDFVEIKGKKEKMKIFELIAVFDGPDPIKATKEQKELASLFTEAYEAFTKGKLAEAKALFTIVNAKFPHDYPTKLYLDRLTIETKSS